jgi:methionyl-tRNA formyltransferase
MRIGFLYDPANDWLAHHFPQEAFAGRFAGRYSFEEHRDLAQVEGCAVVFLLGCTRLVPQDFLQRNGLTLVVHESALPKGRGFAPVQWQILEGQSEIPLCLFEATPEADAGDILATGLLRLDGSELYEEIRAKQAAATFEFIQGFLERYPELHRMPQSGEPSRYPRRTPEDSELSVDKTLREQFNLLRIGNNEAWPCFFVLNSQKYILTIGKAK